MKNPLISIVVPFYKVEDFIVKCLYSIMIQTYENIEIICVNDCSPDNSEVLISYLREIDPRIQIVRNQINRGLGGARNAGIDVAKGEFIVFVDSDDGLRRDAIEKLYQDLTRNNVDLTVCAVDCFYPDGYHSYESTFHYERKVLNHVKKIGQENKINFINLWPSAINKLYKLSIIKENKLRFPEKVLYEDHSFYYDYLRYCSSYSYVSDALYFYRKARPGSITSEITGRENEIFKVIGSLFGKLDAFLGEDSRKAKSRIMFRLLWERNFLLREQGELREWYRFCRECLNFMRSNEDLEYLRSNIDEFVSRKDPFYKMIFSSNFTYDVFLKEVLKRLYKKIRGNKRIADCTPMTAIDPVINQNEGIK